MANKTIDIENSATQCASDINDNFEELYGKVTPNASGGWFGNGGGENTNLLSTPGKLLTLYNTVKMTKQMHDSRLNLSVDYGHEPQMLIHGDKAYIVYNYHENGTTEGWNNTLPANEQPGVRLSIVSLDTMTVDRTEWVSGINHGTNYATGSANLVLIDSDTIRIIFGGNGLEYRDYSISNGTFGSISWCKLVTDDTTNPVTAVNATFSNLQTVLGESGDGTIQAHSQYAKIGNTYYICLGGPSGGHSPGIFTTTDFINFKLFAKIDLSDIASRTSNWYANITNSGLDFKYEMSVYPWVDTSNWECCLMLAMRRGDSASDLLVMRMYTGKVCNKQNDNIVTGAKPAGQIDRYIKIPCKSSRMCFFSTGNNDVTKTNNLDTIYLMYDNPAQVYPNRFYTNVSAFGTGAWSSYSQNLVAQCMQATYPSIVYNSTDGYYYIAYQAYIDNENSKGQKHVYLSRFKPFSATFNKVINAFDKMFNTFEPQ